MIESITHLPGEPNPLKGLSIALPSAEARAGSALFVLCGYHGGDGGPGKAGRLLAQLLRRSHVLGHRIVHRDFYANPRDLPYMVQLAAQVARHLGLRVDATVLDSALGDTLVSGDDQTGADVDVRPVADPVQWRQGLLADAGRFDAVVLFYPDALGLGCEHIEKAALRMARRPPLVVNGRRRVFELDPRARRALGLRRFLARTRLPESIFALAILSAAAGLAAWDAARGRS